MRQVCELLRPYKQPLRVLAGIIAMSAVGAAVTDCVGASPAEQAANLHLPPGFTGEVVASVHGARELAALPNGDLLVGTEGHTIAIVPHAENPGAAGEPKTFVELGEGPAAGVALGPDGAVYAATDHFVWRIAYHAGAQSGSNPQIVARVRQGPVAPHSDGDVHSTTSVAVSPTTIFISVGSSCNACTETDPTRATIQQVPLRGGTMSARATHIRNAIALTIDPASGHLWAAGAGQDNLPYGHPYEFADDVSARPGVADYGWPSCEEDHHAYNPLGVEPPPSCDDVVVPLVELPAYATHIGAVFYPSAPRGAYAFPGHYRGGLFIASHGSWHCCPATVPRVEFVPMRGDRPAKPVNWDDPTTQWEPFLSDARAVTSDTHWKMRFTGIAVGSRGSLFVADDLAGEIYRIRPAR